MVNCKTSFTKFLLYNKFYLSIIFSQEITGNERGDGTFRGLGKIKEEEKKKEIFNYLLGRLEKFFILINLFYLGLATSCGDEK